MPGPPISPPIDPWALGFFDSLSNFFTTGGTSSLSAPLGASIATDGTDPRISELFGLNTGRSSVTPESVLTISTVYACIDRISKSIAALPWDVLNQSEEDDRRVSKKALSHPCYSLLHTQPHPLYGSSTFRRTLITHLLLKGNFYAEIQTESRARPTGLKIWKESQVSVYQYEDRLYYQLAGGRVLMDYQMIHLKGFSTDGLIGRSPIRVSMDTFQMALETQRFGTAFYQNGTRLSGMMTNDGSVKPENRQAMRRDWEEMYSNATGGTGKTAFLSDGWKYQQIGIAPDEAQFLETRKYSRTEVCALFGVPPHMVMDLENATFSNIENQNIWYVVHTLMPIITNIEEEFNRKLFRDSEQGSYYNKINVKGLLRGDTAAQTAQVSAYVDRGIYSINEARALDDLNPAEWGDQAMVQGAMVPISLLSEFYQMKIKQGDTTKNAVS